MASEPTQPIHEVIPGGDPEPATAGGDGSQFRLVLKWVIAGVIVLLVAYPLIQRLSSDSGSPAGTGITKAAEASLNRSLQAYRAARYQEAISAARDAIKETPNYALAYNNLAVSYLQLHMYDDAIRNANEAIRLQPDLQLAKNNLAWIQQEKNKTSAIPFQPGTAGYYLDQSLQQYQAGKFQESIDSASQALKSDPKSAIAYNNIAAGYASMKMWDPAIENARKALQINPDFQMARNNLNWALNSKAGASAPKK